MDGPRSLQEAEFSSLVNFLDDNLRSDDNWSIKDEYPLALNKKNLDNIKVISVDGKIASHAVSKNLIVMTPIGLFNIAAIGNVTTDPSHRNKHYASKIVENCVESSKKRNCDFSILWTDKYTIYQKLGFELAGFEVNLQISKPLAAPPLNLKVLNTKKVSPQALLNLYTRHTSRTLRTLDDVKSYLDIPNSNLYTAWTHDNQLVAYAVEGRGKDFGGYFHEWGGDVPHITYLLAEIQKNYRSVFNLISPAHSQNLINSLKNQGATTTTGFLGMINVNSFDGIFEKLTRYSRYFNIKDLVLKQVGDNQYIFGLGEDTYQITGKKSMTQFIFGPSDHSIINKFSPEVKEAYEKILPMPMWVWGWDSV
ncbi:GNAT family N-acetyltransferase [bacterium]|nr:GNAT family N-acetyltransferase [bacterium]